MAATSKQRSKRYGKRFSSPYAKWPCGHRRNPSRKRHQRKKAKVKVVVV